METGCLPPSTSTLTFLPTNTIVDCTFSRLKSFDPEALLLELQSEETSMDVSNRGQQHSNSRFNASAPINSDVGFVSGALLCRLQSKEMTRGVSKGQHHGSHQMAMKPPLSGSLRRGGGGGGSSSGRNDVPAKEIISSATTPRSIKIRC
ncbi:hypothetical protein ACLOJK_011221 [Asimina triloba]